MAKLKLLQRSSKASKALTMPDSISCSRKLLTVNFYCRVMTHDLILFCFN